MRDSLSVGDEVTTIGGIVGKVVHIKDDLVTIETSEDRVRIEFTRWAISTKGTQTTESKYGKKYRRLLPHTLNVSTAREELFYEEYWRFRRQWAGA